MKAERLRELLKDVRDELSQLSEAEYWRQFDEHQSGDIAGFIGDMGLLDARPEEPETSDPSTESSVGDSTWLESEPFLGGQGVNWLSTWSLLTWFADQSQAIGAAGRSLPASTWLTHTLLDVGERIALTIPQSPIVTWALDASAIMLSDLATTGVLFGAGALSPRAIYSDMDEDLEWAA